MPRLRVTASLSLLALALGVAATQWLSAPAARRAPWMETGPGVAKARPVHRRHAGPVPALAVMRPRYATTQAAPGMPAGATLVPIATPTSTLPTSRMAHHAVGNVLLHVTVDGQGQVIAASVAQSSGDDVLDANAMLIARHWRFAVPADHPQGLGGDLPIHFAGELAHTP
jgi:protein TonB